MSYREQLGLPASRTYVESLYDTSPADRRDLGAVFTAAEAREVETRIDLLRDREAILTFLAAHGFMGNFGGTFVDNRLGHEVLMYCADSADVQGLLSTVPHPDRLEVRRCDYSEAALDDTLSRITTDFDSLDRVGVNVTSVRRDLASNRVIVRVADSRTAAAAAVVLVARYGGSVAVAGGTRFEPRSTQAGRFNDIAPYQAGAEIHSTTGKSCTLGFAIIYSGLNYSLTAGHCSAVGDVFRNGTSSSTGGVGTAVAYVNTSQTGGNNDSAELNDYVYREAYVYLDYPSEMHVTGISGEQTGMPVCMSGAYSGYHCGVIHDTNVSTRSTSTGVVLTQQREVCDGSSSGDSGAPVWTTNGGASAQGVLGAGASVTDCPANHTVTGTTSGTGLPVYVYTRITNALLDGATLDTR